MISATRVGDPGNPGTTPGRHVTFDPYCGSAGLESKFVRPYGNKQVTLVDFNRNALASLRKDKVNSDDLKVNGLYHHPQIPHHHAPPPTSAEEAVNLVQKRGTHELGGSRGPSPLRETPPSSMNGSPGVGQHHTLPPPLVGHDTVSSYRLFPPPAPPSDYATRIYPPGLSGYYTTAPGFSLPPPPPPTPLTYSGLYSTPPSPLLSRPSFTPSLETFSPTSVSMLRTSTASLPRLPPILVSHHNHYSPTRPTPQHIVTTCTTTTSSSCATPTATPPPLLPPPPRESKDRRPAALLSSRDMRIPSGKEGSLKHRILTTTRTSTDSRDDPPSPKRRATPNAVTTTSTTAVPSPFLRGSAIRLASGETRRVQELCAEDFVVSAKLTPGVRLDNGTVVKMEDVPGNPESVFVTLAVSPARHQVSLQVAVEHPFFVLGQGWSSWVPERSMHKYGLSCNQLRVGDVCIALSPQQQSSTENNNNQSQQKQQQSTAPSLPTSVQAASPTSNVNGVSPTQQRKRRWSAPEHYPDNPPFERTREN